MLFFHVDIQTQTLLSRFESWSKYIIRKHLLLYIKKIVKLKYSMFEHSIYVWTPTVLDFNSFFTVLDKQNRTLLSHGRNIYLENTYFFLLKSNGKFEHRIYVVI